MTVLAAKSSPLDNTPLNVDLHKDVIAMSQDVQHTSLENMQIRLNIEADIDLAISKIATIRASAMSEISAESRTRPITERLYNDLADMGIREYKGFVVPDRIFNSVDANLTPEQRRAKREENLLSALAREAITPTKSDSSGYAGGISLPYDANSVTPPADVSNNESTANVSQIGDVEITNIVVPSNITVAEVLNPPKEEIA